MTADYAFPAEHWPHLRTTNVIASPFAAVRLRPSAAQRFKYVENATALLWKTLLVVESHFRALNAPHLSGAPDARPAMLRELPNRAPYLAPMTSRNFAVSKYCWNRVALPSLTSQTWHTCTSMLFPVALYVPL